MKIRDENRQKSLFVHIIVLEVIKLLASALYGYQLFGGNYIASKGLIWNRLRNYLYVNHVIHM